MADLPPPPPGFRLERPRKTRKLPLDDYSPRGDVIDLGDSKNPPPGFELEPTGDVVDGDTIRLTDKRNARLSGFDAWESDQLGYRPGQGPLMIGAQSTNALSGLITPQTDVRGIGKETFGRPVVVARNGDFDVALPMLWQGQGLAAPEYLRDDPQRRAQYLEAERLGRLNKQGGHAAQVMSPDAYRTADRWNLKVGPAEEAVFTNDLPELRPEFPRVSDAERRDFFRFLATKSGDATFSQADLDAYWKAKGRTASEPADPKFIEQVRKGERYGGDFDYSAWDAATLADFNKQNAFAGMRPEVQEAYGAMLSAPDASPERLAQFAAVNGMTFDPRDVSAFFDARAKGENAPIPLPLINPGDGRTGAAARGFGDPLGVLDETGAFADAVGLTGNRENIFNSDRSFGDIYENNLRQNRAIIDYDETNHPYMRAGGQIASGIALPFGGGVRGAAGLAKAGAIEGGIYGFGSADGNLGDRLLNVPLNALGGAVIGGTVGKAIDVATPIVQRAFARGGEALPASVVDDIADLPPPPAGFQLEGSAARADMAADDAAPSIASERIPDTIDVSAARTRPLSDGPSPDMIRAATARVELADVLPRASNELTAEEAARLGEGPYQPVAAPRERDYLDAREYPSRANPDNTITRRGPADLVTFARSLNGIRDEGGELTAAGISNAARKGDDFAGGENRLGRLVNDDGVTIEEAAHRAWTEGYFPELAGPPTREQFVAALDDTYRGVNRRFRPDDEPEIQAFEGARDQRLAVERAKQDGAPLVDDLGQPTTYDDVVANTPPALDPDDWNPATLAKVGNVRVDKLDSPQEISRALKVADDIAGGFETARRGTIAHAETRALAQDLGMTANDLLARRKGQAFSAEEAYAARAILAKSGNELVNMAKRLQRAGDDPGAELLAAFRKAMVRHTAIQEQVSGMSAEAGRALSQFRMIADSRDIPGRVLEGLVNAGGGQKRLKEAAEMIIDLERDPATLNKFIEKASKPKWSDKLTEIWYNFLLSGPQTHVVNMVSNTLTTMAQIPEHAIAASLGAGRRAALKEASDRVPFTEVGARIGGLLQGTKEGMREFARALRTGEASDFVTKVENQSQKAVSGLKGEVLRLPTRFLTAEDELFKATARRMEIVGLAARQAGKEGLKGKAAAARAAELAANPTDEMWQSALDYGRYVTFQRPLGPIASLVSIATQRAPILKAILPFIRTPTNLFKFAIERSPMAPLLREWRRDFAAGGAKRDLAVARTMVGTGMGATFAELASRDIITGSAPRDENKRRLMMADGWQPYSIKIGDKYYSYQRLDPFALTIGAAADMATLDEGMSENQKAKGAALVWASIMGNLSNKTWLSGVSDMLSAIDDPERYGDAFIKRLAGSIAVPTGVAQIARTVDPIVRETPDSASAIQSRVPGLSDDLLPKRDVWGRPIEKEGGVGPDIMSPIWTSTAKADPATWEAIRVNATIGPPQNRDGLEPAVFDRWKKLSGETGHKWVTELIKLPGYREADADEQRAKIKFMMEKAREAAKANVLSGTPIPTLRPEKGQRRNRQPTNSAPPPPPGFELER